MSSPHSVRTPSLFALLVTCASSCGSSSGATRPNVILICLDTVRADRLGAYGYEEYDTTPRLDRLANESTLFLDASAAASWTKPSVPSFLTGTYPMQHGVYEGSSRDRAGERSDVLPESAITLAEVYQDQGYATAAFVRNAQLRTGMGFEQGFDLYRDEAGDAREIRWRAQDWLDQRVQERPFFLYLHLLDAHWPYPIPDEYATRFASADAVAPFRGKGSRALWDAVNDGERSLAGDERLALEALYAGSLRYIDDELGQLFDWMERHGAWEDTIVSVVSDHGEEFGEHGRLGHGHGLHENLLRVPWILRVPRRAPQIVQNQVSLVDLFPTLLSASGIAGHHGLAGVDRLHSTGLARPVLAEHKEPDAYQQSLRAGTEKLVRRFRPNHRAASSDTAPRLHPGRRYDVELERTSEGLLVASRLQEGDDDPSDPLELKGPVVGSEGDRFLIGGVRVRLAKDVVFYGALPEQGAASSSLQDGRLVKVVADTTSDGLLARRVKLYELDARPEFELRATLEALEGQPSSGRAGIGGLWVELNERTRLEIDSEDQGDLTREAVHAWISDLDSASSADIDLRLFDLGLDPDELAPKQEGPALATLQRTLNALGSDLTRLRLWSSEDQRHLDQSALEDLRALGYVR